MARVGGRQKGSLNRVTAKFKEAVQIVYEDIGGHAAFAQWAKENPGDFYRICSKLIPAESAERVPSGPMAVTISIGCVEVPGHRLIEQEPELIGS